MYYVCLDTPKKMKMREWTEKANVQTMILAIEALREEKMEYLKVDFQIPRASLFLLANSNEKSATTLGRFRKKYKMRKRST